jgi:HD superfamily phosphohydrolase
LFVADAYGALPAVIAARQSTPRTLPHMQTVRSVRDNINKRNLRLTALEVALVNTPVFQRMDEIRQLNVAHYVYRGAQHTRFSHMLGANALAKRAVRQLVERSGEMREVSKDDRILLCLAALLHDIAHRGGAGSHTIEDLELDGADHEEEADALLQQGDIGAILDGCGIENAAHRIGLLIRGKNADHPLQRLLSSNCDVDKLDYLVRDARHCGVPYGEIDVERLLDSLLLVRDPVDQRLTVALAESGLGAFEHMLFARKVMYSEVYYHRAVRSASAMMQRLVWEAVDAGVFTLAESALWTDSEFHIRLSDRLAVANAPLCSALHQALVGRRLYKEAAAFWGPGLAVLQQGSLPELYTVVDQIAADVGLAPGTLLFDVPRKPHLLGVSGLCKLRSGDVVPIAEMGNRFPLAAIQQQMEESVYRLRVFTSADCTRRLAAKIHDAVRARGLAVDPVL